jgi:hypothetical protein
LSIRRSEKGRADDETVQFGIPGNLDTDTQLGIIRQPGMPGQRESDTELVLVLQ